MSTQDQRAHLFFLILLSLAHGIIDLSGGAVVALLPTIRSQFTLSYTMVGAFMLFSNLASSLTQPVFGLMSDRSNQRWLLPFSLFLGGIGLAAIGWMPAFWLVVAAAIVNSMGTASFHPEGGHAAHNLAGTQRARAMAIYGVGGNIGYALGPLYAGLLLALGAGTKGTVWALVLPGLLALIIIRLLPRWQRLEHVAASHAPAKADLPETSWRGTVLLTAATVVRSVINSGILTYIPFFWIDKLGHAAGSARYIQVMYLIAGVGGTLLGAPIADRIGARRLLILSFALLLPLHIVLPFLTGWALLAVLFVAGFVVVSTFTTTLVLTQEYMPRSPGLASGLNLGLASGLGGIGVMFLGMIADHWGVVAVLEAIAALVPVALLLTTLLPKIPAHTVSARELPSPADD
ncbi:MAG: MFS transporter [Mycobacterium leprae]